MYSTSVPDNQSDLTNINKAIYGKDTRRDAHEITAETVKDSKIVLSSLESVSAIFESTDIIDQKNGTSCLRYSTFEQYILRKYQVPLAKNQRFHNQPSAALGTAFLVTPTLIVTARHCVYDTEWEDLEELLNNIIKMPIVNADKVLNDVQFKQIMNKLKLLPGIIPTDIDEIFHAADKNMLNIRLNKLLATFTKLPKLRDINKLKFVFGYKMTNDNVATTMFNNEDIYSGVRVIDCLYKVEDGEDWAIIELDRPVKNCTPVKLRQQGKIEDKTPLYVLGYPSGLPIKYADGAEVRIAVVYVG